jgi:hypothetical protein
VAVLVGAGALVAAFVAAGAAIVNLVALGGEGTTFSLTV